MRCIIEIWAYLPGHFDASQRRALEERLEALDCEFGMVNVQNLELREAAAELLHRLARNAAEIIDPKSLQSTCDIKITRP